MEGFSLTSPAFLPFLFLLLVSILLKLTVQEERRLDTSVFPANASRETLMNILSQMTSLLWLQIVFCYQMLHQLWQLEFKAVPLQQRVSLVDFLENRLMPGSMWLSRQQPCVGFFKANKNLPERVINPPWHRALSLGFHRLASVEWGVII